MQQGPSQEEIERKERLGYIYINRDEGFVHIDDMPNGLLYEFGADIFEEMFGKPEEENEKTSEPTEDSYEMASLCEVFSEICYSFKRMTDNCVQRIRDINLFGPHYVTDNQTHTVTMDKDRKFR